MNKKDNALSCIIETTSDVQQEQKTFARFGRIISIQEQADTVRVDFEGNSYQNGLVAKLGRAFTYTDLELALQNQLSCRIEFIGGDANLPIITDIFFSIMGQKEELVLKSKRIRIEAEQELVVKSGDTSTRYSGRDNRVSTNAKYITSNAEKSQKIRGSTVSIN